MIQKISLEEKFNNYEKIKLYSDKKVFRKIRRMKRSPEIITYLQEIITEYSDHIIDAHHVIETHYDLKEDCLYISVYDCKKDQFLNSEDFQVKAMGLRQEISYSKRFYVKFSLRVKNNS